MRQSEKKKKNLMLKCICVSEYVDTIEILWTKEWEWIWNGKSKSEQ